MNSYGPCGPYGYRSNCRFPSNRHWFLPTAVNYPPTAVGCPSTADLSLSSASSFFSFAVGDRPAPHAVQSTRPARRTTNRPITPPRFFRSPSSRCFPQWPAPSLGSHRTAPRPLGHSACTPPRGPPPPLPRCPRPRSQGWRQPPSAPPEPRRPHTTGTRRFCARPPQPPPAASTPKRPPSPATAPRGR